jgi:hypothetical protein
LAKNTHDITLGSWEHKLRIEWIPVCIALTHLSKANEKKYRENIATYRSNLDPLDIRISEEINRECTTHVTANKRNVAATLEGLTHGSYIVTAEFIAEIEKVGPKDEGSEAPLESDFDGLWPDASQFVPPAATEPMPRETEVYAPNPGRQTVFGGYTFIFCMRKQMDNLQGPITQGGGKALFYNEFEAGVTRPEDFVAFVKKKGGNTGIGELRSNGPGVVVVRISGDDAWAQDFVQKTDLLLGQRSILQNEFLDPILMNDARVMRQPLQEEEEPSSSVAPSQSIANGNRMVPSTAAEPIKKLSARARRLKLGRVKSRFKGFDDFEETPLSEIPTLEEKQEEDVEMQDSLAPIGRNGAAVIREEPTQGRKRAIGQSGLEAILPTAAEVKRRRIQAGVEDVSQTQATPAPTVQEPIKPKPKLFNRTITKKSIFVIDDPIDGKIDQDLRNVARAEKEREEKELHAQRLKETLEHPLDEEEIEEIRRQIQYGEMKVRQSRKADKQQKITDDGWNNGWNGRQNYKKFRRKGEAREQPLRGNRVIVTLEVASTNENPLGSVRWATTSASSKQRKKTHVSSFENVNNDEDDSQFRPRPTLAETEFHLAMLEVLSDDEGIAVSKDLGHVPQRGMLPLYDDSPVVTVGSTTQADSVAGSVRPNKRPADRSMAAPPPKRQTRRMVHDSDDDDVSEGSEEDLRFKFSSRTKRK